MGNKIFDVVQVERPNRNAFDLTHDHKTTTDMGRLTPVCIMECLPGDKKTIGAQALVRFSPLVAPPMQRFDARIEYFFVPSRIVWPNWPNFIASDPGDLGAIPAFPTLSINQANYTKLMNHMGIPQPINGVNQEVVNAIPFAAYQLIVDEYYRDQNLVPPNNLGKKCIDGDNTANLPEMCEIKYRSWEHDYFTSCLPFAQKGEPVTIGTTSYQDVLVKTENVVSGDTYLAQDFTSQPSNTAGIQAAITGGSTSITLPLSSSLWAATSELDALSVTINDLREAEALQKWLEINARAGTRPNEVIAGHFGVKSSDARLQRPEYIVGVKQPVQISEVLNTSGFQFDENGDPIGAPQGNMAGHAYAAIDDENYGSYFCEEHGYIIGIMSIMPKTSYQQGLQKFWLKTTDPTQYFWPSFAHIGEQPVLKKELFAFQGATGNDTFGYLPAYQDYRFVSNMVTGQFQDTLSYWTCGRIFDQNALPQLNAEFVTASNVRKDIFAVTDPTLDSLYVHVLNKVYSSRLIPEYGTPTL